MIYTIELIVRVICPFFLRIRRISYSFTSSIASRQNRFELSLSRILKVDGVLGRGVLVVSIEVIRQLKFGDFTVIY